MCEQFFIFNPLQMETVFLCLRRKRNGLILEHRVGFDFAMHADWQGFMVLRESNEVVRNIFTLPRVTGTVEATVKNLNSTVYPLVLRMFTRLGTKFFLAN